MKMPLSQPDASMVAVEVWTMGAAPGASAEASAGKDDPGACIGLVRDGLRFGLEAEIGGLLCLLIKVMLGAQMSLINDVGVFLGWYILSTKDWIGLSIRLSSSLI